MKYCPCGSTKRYLDCCGAYLEKKAVPATPEALMRSRYTAFVEGKVDYLQRTMRPPALLKFNKKEAKKKTAWSGLEVIETSRDLEHPEIGFVEFKAYYQLQNQRLCMHEKSIFHFIDGRWYYVDGFAIQD